MARSSRNRYLAGMSLALALGAQTAGAQTAVAQAAGTAATSTTTTATTTAAPAPAAHKSLRDFGITPHLAMLGMYMSNLSMGQVTGKSETVAIFSLGADVDLSKLAGLPGASLHFQTLYVPTPDNDGTFGAYGGDVLIGQGGPYIPKDWHLSQFTYEQKLLGDRLDLALGIDNAGNYFGVPVCNQGFLCQGVTLQQGVGMNPPPYANWSARAAYKLSPNLTAQVGFWRDNSAFPFSTGLQGWHGTVTTPWGVTIPDANSSLYLANLVYQTDPKTNLYPGRYELMLYYNDATQSDPATGATHKGTRGIYLGGRQTVWRAGDDPDAMSLDVYSSLYQSFDGHNSTGVGNELDAGLIVKGLFRSRPHDTYGLSFIRNHLTSSEQSYLVSQNTGSYTVGQDEYAVGLNANMMLGGKLILQPWVNYVWNVNTYQNPTYSGNPKSGWAVGVNFVVLLDKMLGL